MLISSCHFWKHKSDFLQNFHQYSVLSNITRLYFSSSNIIYFGQIQPIKLQYFEIFKCSCSNSSNSSCQFWTVKSISLQFLHHSSLSWHITPLFKLIQFQLWTKGYHESPNFETFKCSGEDLANSLCHFWKHKLVFL